MGTCGEILRDVMTLTGWNAYEVSQQLGLDRGTISRILKGSRSISHDVFSAALERAGFRLTLEMVGPIHSMSRPNASPFDDEENRDLLRRMFVLMRQFPTDGLLPGTVMTDTMALPDTEMPSDTATSFGAEMASAAMAPSDTAILSDITARPETMTGRHSMANQQYIPRRNADIDDGFPREHVWEQLKPLVVELCANRLRERSPMSFSRALTRIEDPKGLAFLAGLYRYLHWDTDPMKPASRERSAIGWRWRLERPWTPVPFQCFDHHDIRAETSHIRTIPYLNIQNVLWGIRTDTLIPVFLRYNVLIPRSELE